jgi:hypothetical protein
MRFAVFSLWVLSGCLLVSVAWGQTPSVGIDFVSPETIKHMIWGGDSLERGMHIARLGKKDFLVAGLTYGMGNKGDALLLKVNEDMSVKWQKNYGGEGFDFVFSIHPAHDGNYMMTGFTNSYGAGGLDCWMVKVNERGDTIWTKTWGGPKDEQAYNAVKTRDRCYVVVGQTRSWGNGDIDALLFKINESGELLWSKTFGGELLDRAFSVVEMDNGDLMVSGMTNAAYPQNSDILLLKTNKDGELLWQKQLGSPKGDIAHAMLKYKDNTVLIVGYSAETGDSLSDPLLMQLDENGNLLDKVLPATKKDVRIMNGYITDNGDFAGTGFIRDALNDEWDILLLHYSFRHKMLTMKRMSFGEKAELTFHAAHLKRGKALVTGHTFNTGNQKGDLLLLEWKYN